jgi:hypothetical protein
MLSRSLGNTMSLLTDELEIWREQILSKVGTMQRNGVGDDAIAREVEGEIGRYLAAVELAEEGSDHPELDELAEIEHMVNSKRSVKATAPKVDIPDEALAKLASILRVPDANRDGFYEAMRKDVDDADLSARRNKREVALEDPIVRRCVDKLTKVLATLSEHRKSLIETELGYNRKRMLVCDRRRFTALVTVRPIQIDDVIEILQSLSVITHGPSERALRSLYKRRRGRPLGTASTGEPLRKAVRQLLRRVEEAGAKRIGVKRLIKALDLLRKFLPTALSGTLPETTIKRFKTNFERQAKRRAERAKKGPKNT